VKARHEADHADLQSLIVKLNITEEQVRRVLQEWEAQQILATSSSKTFKQERLQIASAILRGSPVLHKHYRQATVSSLRRLADGDTVPECDILV